MNESYASGSQYPPPPISRDMAGGGRDEGVASLLSGLLTDLQHLVRGEVKLARAELQEDLADAGRAVAMIAGAALVGVTGFIFLMLGVTYLLNKKVEMWVAALIVGAVLAVIAIAFALAGKRGLSAASLKPDQTTESLKEDKEWAKQQISSVKR